MLAGAAGFEPATLGFGDVCKVSINLTSHTPFVPKRTHHKPLLYPSVLRHHYMVFGVRGQIEGNSTGFVQSRI